MQYGLKVGMILILLVVAPLKNADAPLNVQIFTPVLAATNMSKDWPDMVDQYVLKIRETVHTTDIDGYLAAVRNPNGALLLDVREKEEFEAGHVPGALNIPRGLLEFRIWKHLGYPSHVDTTRKIYVQCQTGGRATLATKQLQDIGFSNVIAVIMSFEEWQKNGNPIFGKASRSETGR